MVGALHLMVCGQGSGLVMQTNCDCLVVSMRPCLVDLTVPQWCSCSLCSCVARLQMSFEVGREQRMPGVRLDGVG